MIIDRNRFFADFEALARFGALPTGGINRPALSSSDQAARHWFANELVSCGYDVNIDGVGNVVGQYPDAERSILVGSHIDSVPNGGRFDGALGVVAALAIARAVVADRPLSLGVDVIAFSDEEGRFGDLLGSRLYVGDIKESDTIDIVSSDGQSFASALRDAGLTQRSPSKLNPARTAAFLELHIEQGPVLERSGVSIGIVLGVAGITRWDIEFNGRDDHAGTTPMKARQDAGAALVSFLHGLGEEIGTDAPILWTCGSIQLKPGASNVVPGYAVCAIEFRSIESQGLDQAGTVLEQCARLAAAKHSVDVRCVLRSSVSPIEFDPRIRSVFSSAAKSLELPAIELASGAGHDAMVLASHVPTGMIFVPSNGGRSHSPAESTNPADLFRGVLVLAEAVETLAASNGAIT
jgi:N-carbamoyl-L-amino-acid hydrolase